MSESLMSIFMLVPMIESILNDHAHTHSSPATSYIDMLNDYMCVSIQN